MDLERIRHEVRNSDVRDLRNPMLLIVGYLEELEKHIGKVEANIPKPTRNKPKQLSSVGKKKKAVAS